MSRRTIKRRLYKSTLACCGAVGLAVYCALGTGSDWRLGIWGGCVYAQQPTSQTARDNQVLCFDLTIGVETAPILASPSTQTYQTGALSRGDSVEAYFRNESGYCAIRPPQGSFSWINSKFVQLETESVGDVYATTGKSVPSRVGGSTPESSSVVQIGLKNEQKVKILGQTTLSDGSIWFRIAPPPGEFRWIHESSLAQTPSLAQLPTRLTFQSEGSAQPNSSRNEETSSLGSLDDDVTPTLNLAPLDTSTPELDPSSFNLGSARRGSVSPNLSMETAQQGVKVLYDQKTFQKELASLNSAVFKELQKSVPNATELSSLQARAENLFDRAPSDDLRFIVQSTFDAIAKAQIQMQQDHNKRITVSGAPDVNNQGANPYLGANVGQITNDLYRDNGQFSTQNGLFVGSAPMNGQDLGSLQSVNGQFIGTPMIIDGQYVVGATFVDDGVTSATSTHSDSKPKSKLGFAFSSSNHPFRKLSKASEPTSQNSRASRLESSFSHLPRIVQSLEQTTIVPPPKYSVPRDGQRNNSLASSQLVSNPFRGEFVQRNKTQPANTPAATMQSARPLPTQLEALAFQKPELVTNNVNSGSDDLAPSSDASANWKAVTNEPSPTPTTTILPASNEERQNDASPIRSTSSFAPVASKSFDKFETTGVLVEIPNASEGAPRYALLDKADDSFDIVSYLDPDKNVSFDKFVGQKVVVKGTTGSVTINGKTRKHVIVRSLFLVK